MQWEYLRPYEFEEAVKKAKGVCVIPVGAMEYHGPHLPLGCDALKGIAFTNEAANIAEVVACPGAPYFGDMSGVIGGGNIALPVAVLRQMLEALCEECYKNGFKKIVLVSSHGGNKPMLDAFVWESYKNPNYAVYHYYQLMGTPQDILAEQEKYPYLTAEDIAVLQSYVDEKKYGGHGCFKETSCIYHLYPHLVDQDKIGLVDGHNTHRADKFSQHKVLAPHAWNINFPNHYVSIEHEGMNERIARAISEKTIADTAEVFKLIKEDTVVEERLALQRAKIKAHMESL